MKKEYKYIKKVPDPERVIYEFPKYWQFTNIFFTQYIWMPIKKELDNSIDYIILGAFNDTVIEYIPAKNGSGAKKFELLNTAPDLIEERKKACIEAALEKIDAAIDYLLSSDFNPSDIFKYNEDPGRIILENSLPIPSKYFIPLAKKYIKDSSFKRVKKYQGYTFNIVFERPTIIRIKCRNQYETACAEHEKRPYQPEKDLMIPEMQMTLKCLIMGFIEKMRDDFTGWTETN